LNVINDGTVDALFCRVILPARCTPPNSVRSLENAGVVAKTGIRTRKLRIFFIREIYNRLGSTHKL
jgi:hypothetical protein